MMSRIVVGCKYAFECKLSCQNFLLKLEILKDNNFEQKTYFQNLKFQKKKNLTDFKNLNIKKNLPNFLKFDQSKKI